jgi:predicted transcriptional regulator
MTSPDCQELQAKKPTDEEVAAEVEALRRDIRIGEEQIRRGEGIPHEEVFSRLRKRIAERARSEATK